MRPQFKPTKEQRDIVKSMAAMGTPHDDIGRKIGIRSPKTLRKHFRDELDLGAMEANYKVAKTLFQMATSGEDTAATIFWTKTRNGFRQHPHSVAVSIAPPPFIVARDQEDDRS
jgi:hypothetical protein